MLHIFVLSKIQQLTTWAMHWPIQASSRANRELHGSAIQGHYKPTLKSDNSVLDKEKIKTGLSIILLRNRGLNNFL